MQSILSFSVYNFGNDYGAIFPILVALQDLIYARNYFELSLGVARVLSMHF